MLHYARSDTHYLLAVYDHLRIALRSHVPTPLDLTIPPPPLPPFALLNETFARSVKTSASVYEQDAYSFSTGLGSEGWRIILKRNRLDKEYLTALAIPTLPLKTGWGPGEIRLEVLRGLHYWRERKSRELDESTNWIIGNRNLIALVEEAKIPRDVVSLMTILGKNRGGVGEMMRKYREEVIEVINQSLERVTVGSKGGAFDAAEVRKATEGGVDRGVGAVEPTVVAAQGLWDEIISAPAIVATATATVSTSMVDSIRSVASSFFGKSKIVVAPVPVIPAIAEVKASLAASSSSFFGSKDAQKVVVIDRSKVEVRMDIVSSNEAKLAAVARIHNSLVLGGGLANVYLSPFSIAL
jgi:exosome complex exonuclease RRP6